MAPAGNPPAGTDLRMAPAGTPPAGTDLRMAPAGTPPAGTLSVGVPPRAAVGFAPAQVLSAGKERMFTAV